MHLIKTSRTHLDTDGVFAPATITGPIKNGATPADGQTADAEIHAQATVVKDTLPATGGSGSDNVTIRFTLFDGERMLRSVLSSHTLSLSAPLVTFNQTIKVPAAKLWSIGRPHVYSLLTEVIEEQKAQDRKVVIDELNTTIGIRKIKFTANQGFILNDEHVKIRGFCDHNNYGGVGMAVPDRVKLHRAQISRSVGGDRFLAKLNWVLPLVHIVHSE